MSNPQQFIRDVKKTAKDAGISIRHRSGTMVYAPDDTAACSGYFDVENMQLVVSTKRTKISYYGLLAHESSHMDQFLHDKYLWDKHDPGYTLFWEWLSDDSKIKTAVLEEAVQDVIRVELDCERRAIEKIKKYRLPIELESYIQGVNAYLYGYIFALETRMWIPQIYEDDNVISKCSTKLKKNYKVIPQRLRKEMMTIYEAQ